MATLTFYGGVQEIGGNKILLEDGDSRLFLDFGFPYKKHKLFYEEYLKPRGGAGLLDPLEMGLVPPLEGLYREDLATPGLWRHFRQHPLYRKLESVDGVLLSHAHLDHSGHISFLRDDIPIYSTAMTAFIAKAIQDSGKSDFDQQVCYFGQYQQGQPAGWKQAACLSAGEAKKQRGFRLGDVSPGTLAGEATQFWAQGFWEKTAKQKGIDACPLTHHSSCVLPLRCFPVDHSIPGACAWAVETGSGWLVYSGDLRLHGTRGKLTRAFIEEAARLRPRALVLEGTNIRRSSNVTQQEVYENGLRAIAAARKLVIADFSPRDVDRLLTFLRIARETGRKLAILAKDAYLLKTVRLLDAAAPDPAEDDNLVLYQETTASRNPAMWMRNIYQECDGKVVLAEEVNAHQEEYILCFSFFDLNELPSIRPAPGGLYLYSSSEPHDEEQEIDFRRLHNWLQKFGMIGFGLPVETAAGWVMPEEQKGLHASGHACGADLFGIVQAIAPRMLIPVHSENPELYSIGLAGTGIEVVQPEAGATIAIRT